MKYLSFMLECQVITKFNLWTSDYYLLSFFSPAFRSSLCEQVLMNFMTIYTQTKEKLDVLQVCRTMLIQFPPVREDFNIKCAVIVTSSRVPEKSKDVSQSFLVMVRSQVEFQFKACPIIKPQYFIYIIQTLPSLSNTHR